MGHKLTLDKKTNKIQSNGTSLDTSFNSMLGLSRRTDEPEFLANFVKKSVLLACRGLHTQFYLGKNMMYCHQNCDVPSSGIMKREDSYVALLKLRATS